ncbi:MAG TPA: ABC transporter permease, partial [Gemmatimonadaceae bacterium]|nr:ABC transporter permease [Gemmatimonadaceae bacterium]
MEPHRLALRSLRRTPGFTAAAVLVLAIGIGANATMFGVVDTLLLRPPAHVERPEEIVRPYLRQTVPGMAQFTGPTIGFPDYTDLRDGVKDFAGIAAFTATEVQSGTGAEARELHATFVTQNFFGLLDVRPTLGRFFTPDEDDFRTPAEVVVLDHGFWQREFGGDRDVLGREVPIGQARYTVVGVAPPGFTGVDLRPVDVWLPLAAGARLAVEPDAFTSRNWTWVETVARLKPGASIAAAEAAATTVRRRAYSDRDDTDREARMILGPIVRDRGPERSRNATISLWLGGVAVIVLLVACANVANL